MRRQRGAFFHGDGDDAAETGIDIPEGEYRLFILLDDKPYVHGDEVWEEYDSGVDGDLVPLTPEHLTKFGLTEQKVAEIAAEEGQTAVLAAGLWAQGYEEFAATVEEADRTAEEEQGERAGTVAATR